jgi:hypothetical protein
VACLRREAFEPAGDDGLHPRRHGSEVRVTRDSASELSTLLVERRQPGSDDLHHEQWLPTGRPVEPCARLLVEDPSGDR